MSNLVANNGQVVTDEMIENWANSLDADEWPNGWKNVGGIVDGVPKTNSANTETLSIKIPVAMKVAVTKGAQDSGQTTSAFVRGIIENSLISNC